MWRGFKVNTMCAKYTEASKNDKREALIKQQKEKWGNIDRSMSRPPGADERTQNQDLFRCMTIIP